MYAIEIVSENGQHLGWIGTHGRMNKYPSKELAERVKKTLENDPRYKGLFFMIVDAKAIG